MSTGGIPVDDESTLEERPRNVGQLVKSASLTARTWDPPCARDTWRDDVVDSYYAYWDSAVSQVASQLDAAKVVRYFDLLEIEARLYDDLINAPVSDVDHNGKRYANPLIAAICRTVGTSIKLANEIGATPMSRLKLGLTKLEGQRALQQLEDRLNAADLRVPLENGETFPKNAQSEVYEAEIVL